MKEHSEQPKDRVKLFFHMESEYNLFEIKSKNGFPVWDILRNYIWDAIVFSGFVENKNHNDIFFKSRNFARRIFTIPKLYLSQNENFFYGASRFRDEKGMYYDPYYNAVKDFLNNGCIYYETEYAKNKYLNNNKIFDVIGVVKFVSKIIKYKKTVELNTEDSDIILSALNNTFGDSVYSLADIENRLRNFEIEYRFFYWLFKRKKIKRIFFHQNGHQKGIVKAANDLKIPVFEFQHGEIVDSTIVYNYGDPKLIGNTNIIAPNIFLTYSNIWTNSIFVPAKCIEVGSEFFNVDKKNASEANSVVVISSNEHEIELAELVCQLANTDKSTVYYYKLHPAQFFEVERHRKLFENFSNVKVISSEMNIKDLLRVSNFFIAVYSTAMYEALQAGKTLFIYKKVNYLFFKKYFNLPRVYLFDEANEFFDLKANASFAFSEKEIPQFFKPFNPKMFKKAYEDYS